MLLNCLIGLYFSVCSIQCHSYLLRLQLHLQPLLRHWLWYLNRIELQSCLSEHYLRLVRQSRSQILSPNSHCSILHSLGLLNRSQFLCSNYRQRLVVQLPPLQQLLRILSQCLSLLYQY